MIPASGIGLQCTKITKPKNVSDITDVTITNLIRALQDRRNVETMIPPRSWPSPPPGSKTNPERKVEKERKQFKKKKSAKDSTENLYVDAIPLL